MASAQDQSDPYAKTLNRQHSELCGGIQDAKDHIVGRRWRPIRSTQLALAAPDPGADCCAEKRMPASQPACARACSWARACGSALVRGGTRRAELAAPHEAGACLMEGALISRVSSTNAAVHMAMSLFTRSAHAGRRLEHGCVQRIARRACAAGAFHAVKQPGRTAVRFKGGQAHARFAWRGQRRLTRH